MFSVLAVAIWLFAVTHVDTLAVLVAFCTDDTYRLREILAGHYVGFGVGVAGAILIAVVTADFLQGWAFVLGFVPIALGFRGLLRRRTADTTLDTGGVPGPIGRFTVVGSVGIGLSGENIALFVPFFVALSSVELAVVVVLYVLCAGVLFVLAFALSRWAVAVGPLPWLDRWLVPSMLVLVGSYVVVTGWLAL